MVKEKKILLYFISFILGLLTTMIVGISGVFALEYTDIGYIFENTYVTIDVTYETESGAPLLVERNEPVYTQLSAMNVFIDNYQFQANRHYQLEMEFLYSTLKYANTYQVLDQNNNSCSISYANSIFDTRYPRWNFSCPEDTNRIYLRVYNSNNTAITDYGDFTWGYTFLRYTNTAIGDNSGEIGDNIINNNNANTDKIINNNNANTDKIIESNKETQEIIKDQFNTCRDSINMFDINTVEKGKFYDENGSLLNFNNSFGKKIEVSGNEKYGLYIKNNYSNNIRLYLFVFDENNNRIRSIAWGENLSTNSEYSNAITLPENAKYLTISILDIPQDDIKKINIQLEKGRFTIYEPYGEICINKIDETNDKLDGIQGALTDSSSPDISGLENSAGWLPAGPLDSILNLPLTMLNSLINSLGKTCTPLNLTLPYVNSQIQIPCLSTIFAQITGVNGLWTWVGTIASVLILYNYLLNLYAWVDRVLTLRAEFDEAMGADLANWGRL